MEIKDLEAYQNMPFLCWVENAVGKTNDEVEGCRLAFGISFVIPG